MAIENISCTGENVQEVTDKLNLVIDAVNNAATLYNFVKASNVTVVDDTYQEVLRLTTTFEEGRIYEYKYSMTYNYDVANKSAYFRFSIDGGSTWTEFVAEPKDSTDNVPTTYFFPRVEVAGTRDFVFEMRKEAAGNNLVILFLDLVVEKRSIT